MANAFMPSALSSLNAAGQDSLEQIMKQRLFEQQMQQQMLQGQGQLNNFRLDLRQQDAQERYRQDVIAQNDRDNATRINIAEGRINAERAESQAYQQAVLQAAAAYEAGDMPTVRRLVAQFKLPVSIFAERKKEETPDERSRRIQQDEVDRATGKAKGLKLNPELKPTRVAKGETPAKDNPGAPAAFRQALSNRKGTTGYANENEALESVQAKWDQWRQNYPGLELTDVTSTIANIYGKRPSSSNDMMDAVVDAYLKRKQAATKP